MVGFFFLVPPCQVPAAAAGDDPPGAGWAPCTGAKGAAVRELKGDAAWVWWAQAGLDQG